MMLEHTNASRDKDIDKIWARIDPQMHRIYEITNKKEKSK